MYTGTRFWPPCLYSSFAAQGVGGGAGGEGRGARDEAEARAGGVSGVTEFNDTVSVTNYLIALLS